jgi:hypothetical protein
MGKGVCQFWFEPLQIEHPSENEVSFWTFCASTIIVVSFAKVVLLVADVDNIVFVLGLSFVSINMTSCITYHNG